MSVTELITLPIVTNYAKSLSGGRIGFWIRYQSMTFFIALSLTQVKYYNIENEPISW